MRRPLPPNDRRRILEAGRAREGEQLFLDGDRVVAVDGDGNERVLVVDDLHLESRRQLILG